MKIIWAQETLWRHLMFLEKSHFQSLSRNKQKDLLYTHSIVVVVRYLLYGKSGKPSGVGIVKHKFEENFSEEIFSES